MTRAAAVDTDDGARPDDAAGLCKAGGASCQLNAIDAKLCGKVRIALEQKGDVMCS